MVDERKIISRLLAPRGFKLARPRGAVKCIAFVASTALVSLLLAQGIPVRAHPLRPHQYVVPENRLTSSQIWELLQRQDFVFLSTVVFLTTTPGSNATWTSDATWNNSNNTVEGIGAGASGGQRSSGTAGHATGGGGGAYALISNFVVTTPGTTQITYRIGLAGTSVSNSGASANGVDGGATWWNNTVSPGAGTDNTQLMADFGVKGVQGTASQNGGNGGTDTNCWGQTRRSGGRGGNLTGASGTGGSGGGGAAGASAGGNQGADSSSTSNNVTTAGGQGDGVQGGAGGPAGNNAGTDGTAPWTQTSPSATAGGGGGGGGNSTSTTNPTIAGAGGSYGGGGGGANVGSATRTSTSGAGKLGIIVLTWTPSTAKAMPVFSAPRRFFRR